MFECVSVRYWSLSDILTQATNVADILAGIDVNQPDASAKIAQASKYDLTEAANYMSKEDPLDLKTQRQRLKCVRRLEYRTFKLTVFQGEKAEAEAEGKGGKAQVQKSGSCDVGHFVSST